MKCKFKIKLFLNNYNNNKQINGSFKFLNFNKVYLLKSNLLYKIFKSNFLKISFLKKKYNVYIKKIDLKYINNKIEYFELISLNQKFFFINSYNNYCLKKKKIFFFNNKIYPKNIKIIIKFLKKKFLYCDFNFKKKIKKILFFKKYLTNFIN